MNEEKRRNGIEFESFQSVSELREANERLRKEIKDAKKGGLWRTVGAIGGIVTGGLLGGPAGAIAGAKMGEKVFDK